MKADNTLNSAVLFQYKIKFYHYNVMFINFQGMIFSTNIRVVFHSPWFFALMRPYIVIFNLHVSSQRGRYSGIRHNKLMGSVGVEEVWGFHT